MKQLYIITCLCFLSLNLYSQKTTPKDRYYIDFGLGGDAVISKPSQNSLGGFLLNSKSREGTTFLRYQHFINRKWGFFASVHFHNTTSYDINDLPANILPDPKKYYVINGYSDSGSDGSQTFLFGAQYRFHSRYFYIQPYLGLGFSHMDISSYTFDYKARGTNEVYHSQYGFEDNSLNPFCLSPGVNIVWKVSRQIHFFADINYIHHIGSYDATYTVKDLYTGQNIKEEKKSVTPASLLSMKVGLSLPLWFNKRSK